MQQWIKRECNIKNETCCSKTFCRFNNNTSGKWMTFIGFSGVLTWSSCQIGKIAGAHALGMPGTFSPPPISDPDMHHSTSVTHVPWCMPGSLTSGYLWSRRRGKKRSRYSRRMRNPQFCVSGKRPMGHTITCTCIWSQRCGSSWSSAGGAVAAAADIRTCRPARPPTKGK